MLVNRTGFPGLKPSRFVLIELSKIGNFIIHITTIQTIQRTKMRLKTVRWFCMILKYSNFS